MSNNHKRNLFILVISFLFSFQFILADEWDGTSDIALGEIKEISSGNSVTISNITTRSIQGDLYVTGTLNNEGIINVNGGKIEVDENGIINNYQTGIPTAAINLTAGTLNINSGTVNNGEGGAGIIASTLGIINLSGGTLKNGDSSNDGSLAINSGVLNLMDGDLTSGNTSNSNINLFGTDATHDAENEITIPENLTIDNGSIMTLGEKYTMNLTDNKEFNVGAGTPGIFIHEGTLDIPTNADFNNNLLGLLVKYPEATLSDNNYSTLDGEFLDFNLPEITIPSNLFFTQYKATPMGLQNGQKLIIEEGSEYILPPNTTFNLEEQAEVLCFGVLKNQSQTTANVAGDVYITGTIENGSSSEAGTLNINYNGALTLAGGTLINKHDGSIITINTGGSLYNYYGDVDLALGDLQINPGGKFENVRGNNPLGFDDAITITCGGIYNDNTTIKLDRDINIDFTWTITNKATIEGYGHVIDFQNTALIKIAPNASLLLEDVIINNISENQIQCLDTNSTLSLHNVEWIQDGTYSFTRGTLEIFGDVTVSGTNTFSFESSEGMMIHENSTLLLNKATFSYNASSDDLLQMTNATSEISIANGIFVATTGCTLTDGTLTTKGISILQGDAAFSLIGLDDVEVNGSIIRIGNIIL